MYYTHRIFSFNLKVKITEIKKNEKKKAKWKKQQTKWWFCIEHTKFRIQLFYW